MHIRRVITGVVAAMRTIAASAIALPVLVASTLALPALALAGGLPVGMMIIGPTQKIIDSNTTLQRMLGFTKEELSRLLVTEAAKRRQRSACVRKYVGSSASMARECVANRGPRFYSRPAISPT